MPNALEERSFGIQRRCVIYDREFLPASVSLRSSLIVRLEDLKKIQHSIEHPSWEAVLLLVRVRAFEYIIGRLWDGSVQWEDRCQDLRTRHLWR